MASASQDLVERFLRNGCARRPNFSRRALEPEGYKKGWEVRLVAETRAEAELITKRLATVGMKAGKPYARGPRYIVPAYGKDVVDWFDKAVKQARPKRSR